MTTLLPEKNKKSIKKEYVLKFLNRVVWKLTLVAIIWLILEGTIFYSIQIEKESLSRQIGKEDRTTKTAIMDEYNSELESLNNLLGYFEKSRITKTEILEYVYDFKPQNVKIISISINKDGETDFVSLNGVASNRETLLEFTRSLEDGKYTEEFNLPLSSFTKNYDIPFSLTFKYKNE